MAKKQKLDLDKFKITATDITGQEYAILPKQKAELLESLRKQGILNLTKIAPLQIEIDGVITFRIEKELKKYDKTNKKN